VKTDVEMRDGCHSTFCLIAGVGIWGSTEAVSAAKSDITDAWQTGLPEERTTVAVAVVS